MSDISKRIHSIDPVADRAPLKLSATKVETDDVPEFVRRSEPMIPLLQNGDSSNAWLIWTGCILALLWITASVAYFYLQPIGDVTALSPSAIFGLFAAVFFPAITLLLFFIATHKLNKVSSQSEHLAQISQALLRADETAATQAKTLASSIRLEMNNLGEDLASLTDRLGFLQENASEHVELLNTNTSSFLATSDVIRQNLTIQRQSLESMAQTTEAKLDSLSTLVSTREKSLKDTTELSSQNLENAGRILEERLSKYETFVSDIEVQLLKSSELLGESEAKSHDVVKLLSERTEDMSAKIEALQTENATLQTLMAERLELLEKLNLSNNEANATMTETIQHSLTATDKMREETTQSDKVIAKKREELEQSIAAAEAQAKQSIAEQNAVLLSKLDETGTILAKLDARIERLHKNTEIIEAEQLSNAETRDIGLEIPKQTSAKPFGSPLNLKPLEVESVLPSLNQVKNSENFHDLTVEPYTLNPEMRLSSNQSSAIQSDLEEDLLKPLGRPDPVFGQSKKKEKSPWRWKDMMGGFDNANEPAPENEAVAPQPSSKSSKIQSFEAWLNDFDLNSDAIISDGTILDFANAIIQSPADTINVLEQRMPDISQHLKSLAVEHEGFAEAANVSSALFAETINPEIMNRDAIRNRLSTRDGKTYLLALLTS